ncbi:hypothetical protein COW36_22920 [bacterium (Candidatus Blackallbacteria) CG17_big_fil_post_rev_8_21_14_2_50_48_46]|uniref:Uncharacterized protein n=1 Tax=bacterium (Candidatus Blackallbacteria) CG17_big_fil_post_rev_8_21_14_2_50_48_46 TaxID=2014261 RepID=A0A2M7FXT4_9BACT|nr:MAG: hypothetical protein COW64_15990 [bacterium (Candidatus Blackallbacteria) CG18_big_fil_WC_8_21_14_2_50_49_26]PIW14103.1 MAG: hypothetical protein COW36_22920 [bacterium (Candidatus Blackallbacteria) CG17_big_fil_post_rev_8_21_14_2_50_48_46]PIW45833.1 MAG: hypothetical protein COW20_18585 [bacterium (Candidatus Blackallbacteria) CG13_big_fil_rev_8_21_14_2_50_49_14]
MPVSLVHRAMQLRQKLVDYGRENFSELYAQTLEQLFPGRNQELNDDERLAFDTWFVLEYLLPDHRTILSHFLKNWEDGADLVLAEQWHMVIQGIFQVRQLLPGNHFELFNLVNEVSYTVAGNPDAPLPLEKGEYIAAKIIPFQDYHLFTGVIDRLPTRKKNELYELVAEIQLHNPRMAFIDNKERIAQAYRIQAEEYQDFVSFFGSAEVILNGRELPEKMREFYHYRYFQKRSQETGATIARAFQEKYHQLPPSPSFDFLPDLEAQENLGIIYDKTEGMVFLLEYGKFKEIFSRKDFKRIKNWRQVIQGYLEDPMISSLPFKLMAQAYPENTQAVFKALLKVKQFSLDEDFADLIKEHKPMEMMTHLTPAIIPSLVKSKTFLKSLKSGSKW